MNNRWGLKWSFGKFSTKSKWKKTENFNYSQSSRLLTGSASLRPRREEIFIHKNPQLITITIIFHYSLIKEGPEQKKTEKSSYLAASHSSLIIFNELCNLFSSSDSSEFFLLLLHWDASNADWKAEEAKKPQIQSQTLFPSSPSCSIAVKETHRTMKCAFLSVPTLKKCEGIAEAQQQWSRLKKHTKKVFFRFLSRGERQRNTPEREKNRRGEENKVFFSPSWEWKEKSLIKIPAPKLLFEWRNSSPHPLWMKLRN